MKIRTFVALLGLLLATVGGSAWAQGGPPPQGQNRPPMGGPPGSGPGGGGEQAPGMPIADEAPTVTEPATETPTPVLISLPPVPGTEAEMESGSSETVVSPAMLTVRPAADRGAVQVEVKADPGTEWQLQVTSDLQQWSDLASVVIGDQGSGAVELALSDAQARFVRGLSLATGSSGGDEPVLDPGMSVEPELETPLAEETSIYALFSDTVEIFEDGDFIVLRSTGVPNHPSPYFGIGDPLYEAYNGDNNNYRQNPNSISEQDYVFRVPKNPAAASNNEATPLGPIGISINGVAFFNQYAGPNNQPLTNEIDSFDQYGGHPQQRGAYHYHIEPLYLTGQVGRDGFLGLLLDGFPVYGPEENGVEITNADLDEFHGHFGPTKEFPAGIYHYHFTDQDPYLNGAGYYGNSGSVTQ